MSGRLRTALTIAATLSGVGQPVHAQDKPAPIVEAVVGRSGSIETTSELHREYSAPASMAEQR